MKGTHIINVPGCVNIKHLRSDAVKVAKEIGYSQEVVDSLWVANTQTQINNILAGARHTWDVKQGRTYTDKYGKPSTAFQTSADDTNYAINTEEPEMV